MMNTGPTGLVELRKDYIKPASKMLARAFQDDPIVRYALEDDKDVNTRLPHVYEFLLRYYLSYAQGYTTSDCLEGVAVWQRYVRSKMSLLRMITSGAIWPAFRIGIKTGRRMQPFFDYIESKHVELISSPHWYLMVIGVDPEFQGKGYASLLLRGMLHKIDEERLPCYLETEKEENISIYQHFNFNVVEDYIVPETSVKLWAMLRENRPL
jgi:ribosomal protein S18 acetylase RimI-like enzyme